MTRCPHCQSLMTATRQSGPRCRSEACRVKQYRERVRARADGARRCKWCDEPMVGARNHVYCPAPKTCAAEAKRAYNGQYRQWQRRHGVKPEAKCADLQADQIERIIARAYAQIQRERMAGMRPGVDPWQRTHDPVSANAPDTSDLWTPRSVSPKAPRTGRAA